MIVKVNLILKLLQTSGLLLLLIIVVESLKWVVVIKPVNNTQARGNFEEHYFPLKLYNVLILELVKSKIFMASPDCHIMVWKGRNWEVMQLLCSARSTSKSLSCNVISKALCSWRKGFIGLTKKVPLFQNVKVIALFWCQQVQGIWRVD